jgi:tetratricopeptide (TPR) repeat protein
MKRIIILCIIGMVTMSFLEAQDTIKIISDNLQIAEQRYNEGVKLLESGNIQGAINKFTEAINLKPDLSKAYYNRGVAKSQAGLYDEAIADLDKALSYETSGFYYYTRGKAKHEKGDLEGALEDYNAAINFDKNLAEAYYYRASLYFDQGDYNSAIDDLKRAISKKDSYAYAYNDLGSCYLML